MAKRLLLFLIILLVNAGLTASKVQAHFLEADGSIGAVLHLDSSDDPIAGQSSAFYLEFKDKTGKFQPLSCICTADIYQGQQKIASLPLFQGNGSRLDSSNGQATGGSSFTFPVKDLYTMKVIGTPTQDNLFQSFTLVYDIRVARDVTSSGTVSPAASFLGGHSSYAVFIGIGLILIVGYLVVGKLAKNKK